MSVRLFITVIIFILLKHYRSVQEVLRDQRA